MKTLNILLVAASLSVLSTAAFAQPSDSVDIDVARQVALGNVKASNDGLAAQGVVEGRQAARSSTFSATDRLLVQQQDVRDRNKPTNSNY
ncbi:MAG: hypothetical protein P4L98_24290 [Ancalomicrobiaceae bacterium]|nr:hypothetical protein [Ancalomicrobiaceae bacterium]